MTLSVFEVQYAWRWIGVKKPKPVAILCKQVCAEDTWHCVLRRKADSDHKKKALR
jgi:hypothetical protein